MRAFFFILLLSYLKYARAYNVRIIIYGTTCNSCVIAYAEELEAALENVGITDVEVKFLQGDTEAASELEKIRKTLNVPKNMRGETSVSLDDRYLFEESVPVEIIVDFIVYHMNEYNTLVVYNPLQHAARLLPDGCSATTQHCSCHPHQV